MCELARNLRERVAEATVSLTDAEKDGDDYLAEIRVGELEELNRVAAEHDITIPGLSDTIEAHTGQIPVVRQQSGSER